jgi:ribosome-associated protein
MEFSLQGNEFIELNKLIKLLNIAESGGAANQIIIEGLVLRNQKIETRKRCKLRIGDVITIEDQNIKVSIVN